MAEAPSQNVESQYIAATRNFIITDALQLL